jgi:cytochrome c oxidase assembly protein subunit 15
MNSSLAFDLAPALRLALLGVVIALGPLAWVWLRHRSAEPAARLRMLTLLTLFLTFDLVLFGAFTRLTDSGLGCPDWPGCYGNASPLGAHPQIQAAQAAMPTGPVTPSKAWIEMIHRYLATGVGVLITVLALASWGQARRGCATVSPWWATAALVWVCVQGLFGALTVTMKLYPAIVTLHLFGGLGLLALLAALAALNQTGTSAPLAMPAGLRAGCVALAGLAAVQIALGGWVSTNYAVLACSDFPMCQGAWWPPMDFEHGFALLRELGAGKDGGYLPVEALTAIHYTHRLGAYAVLALIAVLAWRLHASGDAVLRVWGGRLAGVGLWQLLSGLSNVVLGWPLWAAVAHTGGAAALVIVLTVMIVRAWPSRTFAVRGSAAGAAPRTASQAS